MVRGVVHSCLKAFVNTYRVLQILGSCHEAQKQDFDTEYEITLSYIQSISHTRTQYTHL